MSAIPVVAAYSAEVVDAIVTTRQRTSIIEELRKGLRDLEKRREILNNAYRVLIEEYNSLKRKINEINSKIRKNDELIQKLNIEVQKLKNQAQELEKSIQIFQKKLALWKRLSFVDAIISKIAGKSFKEKYRVAIEDSLNEISRISGEVQRKIDEIRRLERYKNELSSEKDELSRRLEILSKKMSKVLDLLRDTDLEKNRLSYKIREVESECIDEDAVRRLVSDPRLLAALILIACCYFSKRTLDLVHTMSLVRDRGRFVIAFVKPCEYPYTIFYTDAASLTLARLEIEKLYATTLHELLHVAPVWVGLHHLHEEDVNFLMNIVRRFSSARRSWRDVDTGIDIAPIQFMIAEDISSRVTIYDVVRTGEGKYILKRGNSQLALPYKRFPNDLRDKRPFNYLRGTLERLDRQTIRILRAASTVENSSQMLKTIMEFIILKR
ncbi:MAG: hypothetical protein GXO10_03940 [Crenarchaeota archaeon]|nr:hypothetical protein [Thermoproteota archaeon]